MNSFIGKRIFITGATGFVGSNLVRRALKKGADVFINIRNNSNTWRINDILKDISTIPVDITNYEILKDSINKIKPDIIFHTAVYGGVASQNNVETIFQTNIMGTEKLVRSCENVPYEIFVNTGSSSEYGTNLSPMCETDLLKPETYYGVAKAAASLYCQTNARINKKPIVTLRLFSPYGQYEKKDRLIPSLILSALQKKPPKIASTRFVRDFIFIEDILDAYEAVINYRDTSGQIFNIGSGQQATVGKVTETILKLLGNEVSFETGIPQSWNTEPPFWQANIELAKSGLKWEPRYSLEQGLKKTIDWFKVNQELYTEGEI